MKIVCDACSAKYSIADEKVKGKVFKIRCKKCSNIIVVRGNAGAAADEGAAAAPAGQFDQKETRVYDYGGYEGEGAPPAGDDAVWHVVIDQEQVGPISVAEVGQRYAAGEIDSETYIWREGFADWLPLSQVPDFAALVAGGSTTTPQASAGQDAVASMFGAANYDDAGGTSRSDPNDVFAAHAAKAAAAEADDDGGADDLFGQSQKAKKSDAGGGRAAAAASASAGAGAASPSNLKGQRSENSVLFSLNNLAALASDSPKAQPVASASASSSSSSSGTAQHGGGEGSGLIDIRSMASAYLGGAAKTGGTTAGGKAVGSIDDLPVFSTASFSEPAVIIPTGGSSRGNNKLMYGLLGAVALLAVVLVVVVVILVTGKNKGTTAAAGSGPQVAMGGGGDGSDKGSGPASDKIGGGADPGSAQAGGDPGSAAAGTGSASSGTAGSDPGSAKASGELPGSDKGSSASKPDKGSSASKPDKGSSSSRPDKGSSSSKPDKGSSAAERPPADPGGKCLGGVACPLREKPPACCSKYKGGGGGGGGGSKPPPTGGGGGNSNLAEDLTKSDISAGIAKVRAKVEGCAAKSSAKGTVKVSVKVAGGGNVASVTVKESPDSALGSCVASAVQKATFAKTQNGGSFSYPFSFR